MTFISIICFFLLAIIVLSSFRKNADPLSPGRVFGGIWSLSIGLTDLKLSDYQHEWTLYSWIVFLTGIFAFLAGIFVVYVHYFRTPLLSISEVRRKLVEDKGQEIDARKFFNAIVILFSAYVVAYAIEIAIEGNVPLFSPRPDLLRVSFGVFGLHLIVNAMMGVVLLATEYLLLVSKKDGRKLSIKLVVALSIASFALLLQRYTFFVVAVIVLAMVHYTSRRIRARHVIPLASLLVFALFSISQIRAARYGQEYVYLISKMKFSKEYWIFAEPYMYVTMNLENFARGVDKLDHYYFGYFTFDWLLALAGLKHWLASYFNIIQLPFLISGYNTFTFHWWYFYDFGVIGVVILPFISGIVIAVLYYRLRTAPSLEALMFYSCGVLLMTVSYIMNPLYRLDFVSNLLIIWFINKFVISKRTVPRDIAMAHVPPAVTS